MQNITKSPTPPSDASEERKEGEKPEPPLPPSYERPPVFQPDRAKAEREERIEEEKGPEKEIEEVREQFEVSGHAADDEEEKKRRLQILKEADRIGEIKVESRKIEHLMQLVEKKGVDFAVEVAKKTNDACLLDLFHDKIIEKGLHKDLT